MIAYHRFGVDPMEAARKVMLILPLLIVSLITFAHVAIGEDVLEVYAGDDKLVKVTSPLDFYDARIVIPDPLDPDRVYSFHWDFDLRKDCNLDGIYDNDGQCYDRFTRWIYNCVGQYTVTLTVSDGHSTAKDTLVVTVVDNFPPRLINEGNIIAPLGRSFLLNITAEDDENDPDELLWYWNLGDGTRSTSPGPIEHTYQEMRVYTVTVRVTDLDHASAETTLRIRVVDMTVPIARAGRDRTISVNETVLFDGTSSTDNDGIADWTWMFEYNGTAILLSGPTPDFTFEHEGTYVVGLKVVDLVGNEGADTVSIHVLPEEDDHGGEGGEGDSLPGDLRTGNGHLITWFVLLLASALSLTINAMTVRARSRSRMDFDVFYR